MALQELSTNVINTMVKRLKTLRVGLRMAVLLCVALPGVQTASAQHAFEFAGRIGANALLYKSDYGTFMPNYDVGIDFSYKYRSPYYVGWRIGLGVEAAASTFIGKNGYADSYVVPRSYEPDGMLANINYTMGSFSETQQILFASMPLQLGLYFGNFSMFVGVRAEYPIFGHYWQRIKNANMTVYYPETDVEVGRNHGAIDPSTGEPIVEPLAEKLMAGNVEKTVNGIGQLRRESLRWWYVNPIIDLNYSFKVGDNTDFGIGIYAEYDVYGHKPAATDNTSLMEWHYTRNAQNVPVFRRDFTSVLESNHADGGVMRAENDFSGNRVVTKYTRLSAGIRLTVSLWSVPLDDGKIYRKQGKYKKDCLCDFFYN